MKTSVIARRSRRNRANLAGSSRLGKATGALATFVARRFSDILC
jgi:hypothetical protein